jgi:K+-sensing histidine kinase KdpD
MAAGCRSSTNAVVVVDIEPRNLRERWGDG